MLLLEHAGRKSGVRRYAVLEYVIVSGFGERRSGTRTWRHLEPTLRTALNTPDLRLPMFVLKLGR